MPGLQFWHEVMVVRVEPLGHFQGHGWRTRLSATTGHLAAATRHREDGIQIHRLAAPLKPFRYRAEQGAHIEHLIVEAEVVRRDQVDSRGTLLLPIRGADRLRGFMQLIFRDLMGPERFQSTLEFPFCAHTREAQIVCQPIAIGHV